MIDFKIKLKLNSVVNYYYTRSFKVESDVQISTNVVEEISELKLQETVINCKVVDTCLMHETRE